MKINLKLAQNQEYVQTGLQVKSRIRVGAFKIGEDKPCNMCKLGCKVEKSGEKFDSCLEECNDQVCF